MKFKSPQILQKINYPDCRLSCMCPDSCSFYCEDKVKEANSKLFTKAILFVIVFVSCIFLMMTTFTGGIE